MTAMRSIGVSFLVAFAWVGVARADGPDDQKKADQKRADVLFAEGRKLIDAHDDVAACAKFNEAIKLDPDAAGTMLNLGLCNEHQKKFASALYWFRKAQARAHETQLPEYETAAGDHTKDLAGQVATVKVALAGAPPPDLRVKIDGSDLKFDDFNHAEVDPGHHVLDAGAPGYKSVHQEFDVTGRGGQTLDIQLVQGDNSVIIDRGAQRRKIAIYTAVGGGVLLVASGVVSIWAKTHYDKCVDGGQPTPAAAACMSAGVTTDGEARNYANHYQEMARYVATPLFAGGAVAVGIATYLYLSAPQRERVDRTVFVPSVGPDNVGFAAVGRF
jgi:tetratricopeptide (TPR) repeat protein